MLKVLFLSVILFSSCASFKNNIKSSYEVAKYLCELFYSEQKDIEIKAQKTGIDKNQLARTICENKEELEPFINHITKLQKTGVK
jgi:hypothetical protein